MPLILHNTLTRKAEPVTPADPARVTFYSCGPTVYDDAHIGNFRSFLAADLLRRWIESPLCELTAPDGSVHKGPRQVVHVMNITDVGHMTDDDNADGGGEDKMEAAARRLAEAQRESKKSGKAHALEAIDPRDPYAIAGFYAERFLEDACKLGLKVAIEAQQDETLMPRATDSVPGMIRMIARLVERGFAYQAGDAVYFDVQKFPGYGALSGNTLDNLRGGAGGRVADEHQAEKRHPADFLLWKADPTHTMKWPSPWGEGYPGWHIECSVMSLDRLIPGGLDRVLGQAGAAGGFTIDLHSGGEDNIFPHHECERAQSCACTGADRFARHWFHGRFLLVEGEKMSKSKGNFFTARDLFAKGHEPAAVRLELIKTHYRANANFTEQGLKDSKRRIETYRRFARRLQYARTPEGQHHGISVHEDIVRIVPDFADAMNADLNVAKAISLLDIASTGILHQAAGYDPDKTTDVIVQQLRVFDAAADKLALPKQTLPMVEIAQLLNAPSRVDQAWGALHAVDSILGIVFAPDERSLVATDIGVFVGVDPSAEIEALLAERRDAKKAKDFARADAIRDQLAGRGLAIKDVAGGKVEVSRG